MGALGDMHESSEAGVLPCVCSPQLTSCARDRSFQRLKHRRCCLQVSKGEREPAAWQGGCISASTAPVS